MQVAGWALESAPLAVLPGDGGPCRCDVHVNQHGAGTTNRLGDGLVEFVVHRDCPVHDVAPDGSIWDRDESMQWRIVEPDPEDHWGPGVMVDLQTPVIVEVPQDVDEGPEADPLLEPELGVEALLDPADHWGPGVLVELGPVDDMAEDEPPSELARAAAFTFMPPPAAGRQPSTRPRLTDRLGTVRRKASVAVEAPKDDLAKWLARFLVVADRDLQDLRRTGPDPDTPHPQSLDADLGALAAHLHHMARTLEGCNAALHALTPTSTTGVEAAWLAHCNTVEAFVAEPRHIDSGVVAGAIKRSTFQACRAVLDACHQAAAGHRPTPATLQLDDVRREFEELARRRL